MATVTVKKPYHNNVQQAVEHGKFTWIGTTSTAAVTTKLRQILDAEIHVTGTVPGTAGHPVMSSPLMNGTTDGADYGATVTGNAVTFTRSGHSAVDLVHVYTLRGRY